ncbi:PEP-CTERM sorting domain-containing protein [Rubritalea spongiae]|uniref:PEP-CTERM sorting domain-containing protein n=1 Tax=Rubritalea spongiae TaxID=430797 RepID=A0ABW5DZA8_9BACT
MKINLKKINSITTAIFASGILVSSSSAAVVVNFIQSGSDTIVNYSGSLDLSGLSSTTVGTGSSVGVSLWLDDPSFIGLSWNAGLSDASQFVSPWSSNPNFAKPGTDLISAGSPVFTQQLGILNTQLLLDPDDIDINNVWTGSGSTTFSGVNVADIVDVDTPVVWTLNNTAADTVTWQVPEPSSTFLLGLGGFSLLFHRRRGA